MPTLTVTPAPVYLHCPRATCPGNAQEQVAGERAEHAFTFRDHGGDFDAVENSTISFRVADPDVVPCPHCERPREISGSPRPQYEEQSGFDPNFLIGGSTGGGQELPADPFAQNTENDERMAALEAQNKQLVKQMEKLTEALGGGAD